MSDEADKAEDSPERQHNGPVAVVPDVAKKFTAPIFSDPIIMPDPFVELVRELEGLLEMPVWLFVQRPPRDRSEELLQSVHPHLLIHWERHLDLLPDTPVALLIHSLGGIATTAFQIANLLRDRCNGFTAVVPRYAKSAATLLALGGSEILLGRTPAELGPLDAQLEDPEREDSLSALDEVQALERLRAFALDAFDNTMNLLLERTRKKLSTLFPIVMKFTADVVRPLFENVDVVRYTQMSRILKVAEDYAARLLLNRYSRPQAEAIARHLAEQYSEHPFPISMTEVELIQEELELEEAIALLASRDVQKIFDKMLPFLGQFTAIGPLIEVRAQ